MEIKLLLREKDRQVIAKNFRTGTLLAQGGAPRGQSAYEQAVEGGYTGTKEEFEEALATGITTISENITDVNTIADNITDINTVAENIADVHTVSENIADVNTVADNVTDVNTVAGISSDVTQVSGISNAVQTVSSHDSEVTLVSDNMASVMTTASNIGDVSTVAGISTDVSAVADNNSNVTAVAGNSTNINAVAANEANINAVNANKTNIDAVAGNNTNITTVATNISNVNTAVTNMAAIIAAPTAAQNAANSATNAQKWAEGTDSDITPLGGTHSSKGWANVAKQYAESIGAALKYKGSVSTYSALPSTGQEIGDFWNVLDTGKNYAWTGTEWDDVSGIMDLSAYRTAAAQDVIDSGKQDTLVSGTNIKTVNGNSLLGSGNVDIDALPSQTGQNGKFLTTDGTDASWANVDALPSQTGQSGKFLTTDGFAASWADIPDSVIPDNVTIDLNESDEIQTIGIIDQKTSSANKFWTGTKAEYDAIVTKDTNTTYRTTDENETVYQNSYRIGQVLPSILPISDYGLHLLDGAVIDGTGIYSSFYSYIAGLVSTYPNLFISEADWQTAVTTYGVCGKFVYDSANQTIRLPKITGIIEGTTDVTALGDLVQAGLPNITGGTINSETVYAPNLLRGQFGAFDLSSNGASTPDRGTTAGNFATYAYWKFDASRSSSIYGNSNTVQPQTIKVYYYIVIANSYQTPTGVQISKVATDLNGKVNLNSSWGMPGTNYEDLVVGASDTSYIAPADGYYNFIYQGSNGQWIYLVNDTTQTEADGVIYGQGYARLFMPCKRGDSVRIAYTTDGAYRRLRFYYAQKDNN